ncbi:MAG: carboxy terminal-processing peptidase [Bacteriovoracaceae bacterium]|nr:carboxy terminal-processing peptidase [Bacteriovoracaceae bacterium]
MISRLRLLSKRIVFFCLLGVVATNLAVGAVSSVGKSKAETKKLRLIGNLIKSALESYHYNKIEFDDALSRKSFDLYIKKIDYGKHFFLKSDIHSLKKYRQTMDDQIISGNVPIVDESMRLFKKRISSVASFRDEFFSKKFKFDFEKNEYLELDPDKRDFMETQSALRDYWRKSFKQAVVGRYLSLLSEQEEMIKREKEARKNKDKKKNKKKKEKKQQILTKRQLRKKALDGISKRYKKFFERLLTEKRSIYVENFFNSITNSFDPHTVYLPPKRKEDFDIDISGSLEGIGAVLQEDESYIKVVKIIPGGPAWRGKQLVAEDKIIAVAQGNDSPVDLVDMKVDEAVRYIRGPKGTEVRLTLKRVNGSIETISIIRDKVQIAESYAKSSLIVDKKLGLRVGYIQVPKFYRDFGNGERNCTDDVKKELVALKKIGIDGLILDLRNNGGGALEDARKMSGLFIEQGPIVQVRNHDGNVEILKDNDKSVIYDGPMIVMVNIFSASASEILAGAMQDYGRAVIVGGRNSHGKGTVQAVLNLNQAPIFSMLGETIGALKVTIQKFYRVTGASTQYKGIIPDILLPDPYSYAKNREMDLDNTLPWDEIPGLDFKPWKKQNINIGTLRKRGQARIKKDKRFSKVKSSIEHLTKRREETKVPLKMAKILRQDESNKKLAKKLKLEKENKNLEISHFDESIKISVKKFKASDRKKWKEDLKQRKDEWISTNRKDPVLSETINILGDMVAMYAGKKL